jgi:two-component system sensor kinase FixL
MPSRTLPKPWSALPWAAPAPEWAAAAGYFAAYLFLEWVSFVHLHKGVPVTPWDPGLGVIFALMLRGGSLGGVILFTGMVAAEALVLQEHMDWPIIVGVGAITALSYAAVAALARRHLRIDAGLSHLRDVLLLLGVGLAGAALDTLLLSGFLLAAGQLDWRDTVQVFRPLLVGDLIGIAAVTPLVLRFSQRPREALSRFAAIAPEAVLYLLAIGLTLWAITAIESDDGFRLFYLLFVPVVIAAVRHGLDGACLSLAAAQFALIGVLQMSGYDAAESTEFQTLMLVLTVTGLIVGVVVSEREHSDRVAREAQDRLIERQAEAAHVARINLVSGMASALAHEINQPMTAARALARSAQHLMATPGGDIARAGDNLTTLVAHIDHAGDIMKRMRNFIRRGRPHVSTINLREMIEDSLKLAYAEASTRHVRIEIDVPAGLPDVHGDRVQLEQVLLNLVHNAVESIAGAGRPEGHVQVTARLQSEPRRIEIGVLDNGPGIQGELAEHLFDPLTTSKQDGLGLGLSISASLLEAHGGRVWLHSGQAGATEFRFSLPLDR